MNIVTTAASAQNNGEVSSIIRALQAVTKLTENSKLSRRADGEGGRHKTYLLAMVQAGAKRG